jgi:hypothetical protein
MKRSVFLTVGLLCTLPALPSAARRGEAPGKGRGFLGALGVRDHGGGARSGRGLGGWFSPSNPFERKTLLRGIASGDEEMIAFDRGQGAHAPGDASSRYVIVRDAMGGHAHVLGILTPHAGRQAESIFDTAVLAAPEVGAVFRGVLEADRAATGRSVPAWRARVNLPDRISVDILHVHGDAGGARASAPSGAGVAKGDFVLHDGPRPAATAKVPTAQLGAQHEALLGQMVLEVARAAKARGITDGSLEVSRADAHLTVRIVTGGGFAWHTNE